MHLAAMVSAMAAAFISMAAGAEVRAQSVGPAETRSLSVELNKLEPLKNACRAWLVVQNRSDTAFTSLRLDLVMFGADGVIGRRLAVETAPLASGKTAVRLFDMEGTACDGISRVLLNDVLACRDESGEHEGCLAAIEMSSRTEAEFIR